MMIIPIYNTVVVPEVQYSIIPNILREEEFSRLESEDYVILLPLKELRERKELVNDDFYPIGIIAEVDKLKETPEGIALRCNTKERVDILSLRITETSIDAAFHKRDDILDMSVSAQKDMLDFVKKTVSELASNFQWGEWAANYSNRLNSVNEMISIVGAYAGMSVEEKYALLETDSVKERSLLISDMIVKYKEKIELQVDLTQRYNEKQGSAQKEAMLQKQIEILQKELDSMNPEAVSDEARFQEKIEKAKMPAEVKKEVSRVLKRFKQENPNGHEYSSLFDYLDFVTSLQWKPSKTKKINITKAKEILNQQHYGLDKVKERILQHLAVMSLKEKQSGSIVLLVGAPGTGKTSMGKSIAEALDRKYVRISLGGVRDEAEVRGHRRTYVGAMPGRIMEGIKRAGVMNPVVVLDEIDKLSTSYNGDPASALLEVLDPEQNNTFTDHYMNVPYDLSNVLFICTANSLDTIPGPLLDRMEVISLSGYTPLEKFYIAKEHLIHKSMEDTGIDASELTITDDAVRTLIDNYTMEAGVRGLKKQLLRLCRKTAVKVVEDKPQKIVVEASDLPELLGKKASNHDKILKNSKPGVVTGLAYTQAGGDILFIETTAMNGSGQFHITGQLGDVMKESAYISSSLVKSIFFNEKLNFKDKDVHIHVPSGAIPKDGPSAGITLFTALLSLVSGIPVSNELAMTGEISLRGQVLPIGGLPEKLMAAERAGIKKVLIPYANKEDLKDVPEEIKNNLEIITVETIEDVMKHALNIKLPVMEKTLFEEELLNNTFSIPLLQSNNMSHIGA